MSDLGSLGEKRLICVSTDNNNKFYNMKDLGDGTFEVRYGRVGVTETRRTYPISKWNYIYNQKTRPKSNKAHYMDVTEMVAEEVVDESLPEVDSNDPAVRKLIDRLQRFAKGAVARTYRISVGNVTQAMIDEAQSIIDELASLIHEGSLSIQDGNKLLIQLYHVIPREMRNVNDHLLQYNDPQRLLQREQDNIDTLSQQVVAHERGDDRDGGSGILEAMGIKISHSSVEEIEKIRKLAGEDGSYVVDAYNIENLRTRKLYDGFLSSRPDDSVNKEMLLWHGSRNQNWLSILERGLMIRPSGVVLTGNAFGNGIYFADELGKAYGYTSARGAYWSNGQDDVGHAALYDVFVGKQYVLKWGGGEYSRLTAEQLDRLGGYDSTWGDKSKGSLYRSEFIVYRPNQATIKHLVILK